ncbi:MAG: caspase family protein [Myxococcota bacterium]
MALVPSDKAGHWHDPVVDLNGPITVALVVGVSHYPHLGGGNDPVNETFGFQQLNVSALTAWQIFNWLRHEFRSSAPLAEVWLLLAPSDKERSLHPEMMQHAQEPDFLNLQTATRNWALRVRSIPETQRASSRTVFFWSGHGVEVHTRRQLLLPTDWPKLDHHLCLSVDNLRRGLDDIEAQQILVIDACRTGSAELKEQVEDGSSILDVVRPEDTVDELQRVVLHSTKPGAEAMAPLDPAAGPTLFGRALLDGLRGFHDISLTPNGGGSTVHVDQLIGYLKRRVKELLKKTKAPTGQLVRPLRESSNNLELTLVLAPPDQLPPDPPESVAVQPIGLSTRVEGNQIVVVAESRPEAGGFRGGAIETKTSIPLEALANGAPIWVTERNGSVDQVFARPPTPEEAPVAYRVGDVRRNGNSATFRPAVPDPRLWRTIDDPLDPETTLQTSVWSAARLSPLEQPEEDVAFELEEPRSSREGQMLHGRLSANGQGGPFLLQLPGMSVVLAGDEGAEWRVEAGWTPNAEPRVVSDLRAALRSDRDDPQGRSARLWDLYMAASAGEAAELVESSWITLESLLAGKRRAPFAAVVAGLVLVQGRRFDLTHDWLGNLARWFPTIPDTHVLHAYERMAYGARRDQAAIVEALAPLVDHGLPWTSDGYALATDVVERIGIDDPRIARISHALKRMAPFLGAGTLFATFVDHPRRPSLTEIL